ncbi:MAG: hypothetical protein ACRCZO_05155, partial [Cetobacterium sp.]
ESLYSKYNSILKTKQIYLSKIDLEHDLMMVLKNYENDLKNKLDISDISIVDFLQKAKVKNMLKFLKIIELDHCNDIYMSDEFECLRKLCDD